MKSQILSLTAVIFTLFLLSSCTSTTRITSEPSGATVYVDGQRVGETPYVHEDSRISFSKTLITLEKPGYEDYHIVLRKDEELDMGAVVGGILFQWPFIWTFGYLPEHHYELVPATGKLDREIILSKKDMARLRELNEMYKDGILSLEEYETLKARIGTQEE